VLELRDVAAFDVAEGWVRLHEVAIAQHIERRIVSGLAYSLEISLAEGKRREAVIYALKQVVSALQSWARKILRLLIHHVVTAFQILVHPPAKIKKAWRISAGTGGCTCT
jgi:hypothetical protein